MIEPPLPSVWGEHLYAAADAMDTWLQHAGYEPCHADQRDWLACQWFVCGAGADLRLPGSWSGRGGEPGLQRRGPALVPAPGRSSLTPEQREACPCDGGLGDAKLWAVLTLDVDATSPLVMQSALIRLGQTWADNPAPAAAGDGPWQARHWGEVEGPQPDFPDLPGWVEQVASANADRSPRIFRGTAGAYWQFNDLDVNWDPEPVAWTDWVESTDVMDHATYYRHDEGAASFTGRTAGPRSSSPPRPWRRQARTGTPPPVR